MPAKATLSRRAMLGILAMACAPVRQSLAQSQHTIHLNVPFTAGTGPDLLARILGEELRQRVNIAQRSVTTRRPEGWDGHAGGRVACALVERMGDQPRRGLL